MILIKTKAFTLIELLVWISIISILVLWGTNIDYNRLSQKQKLEIFTNNIKANFERVRNNSLAWKWIWINLNVPDLWQIDYSTSSSWTIITSTSFDNWGTWNIYNSNSIDFWSNFYISQIKCLQLDWSSDNTLISTETWSIEIEWSKISLKWDCGASTSKILELSVNFKSIPQPKIIQINTLNWLIQIK